MKSRITQAMSCQPQSTEDHGALATDYIRMETVEAGAYLRELYGIEGELSRMDTEKDDTFKVTTPKGRRFVLKVSNPTEEFEEVHFLTALLGHVAASGLDLPTPRASPGLENGEIQEITDRAGQRRYLRVLTFLDGIPLDSTSSTDRERRQIGGALARLRLATAGFRHPHDHRRYAWDVQHLLTLRPLLEHVQSPAHRELLAAGLERYSAIAPKIPSLRRQVLHNDFSKSNIIVDHETEQFVTGIIDFGDAVRTAVAIDVSTALLNQLPSDAADRSIDDLFREGRPLLDGYLSTADLTQEELLIIPHLVMGRVVARALLTVWRAQRFPHNSRYILRNTEQGWGQLRWFLDRSPAAISELLV